MEAFRRYKLDPRTGLVRYASVLYSFRHRKAARHQLVRLKEALFERTCCELDTTIETLSNESALKAADRADCLSTYLEWFSRQPEMSKERFVLRGAAETIFTFGCEVILKHSAAFKGREHTWCLLMLTGATFWIARGNYKSVLSELEKIAAQAHKVSDPKQRARVYRKLGMRYRQAKQPLTGLVWGVRAIFVPHIPLAVRAKSVIALIAPDS